MISGGNVVGQKVREAIKRMRVLDWLLMIMVSLY